MRSLHPKSTGATSEVSRLLHFLIRQTHVCCALAVVVGAVLSSPAVLQAADSEQVLRNKLEAIERAAQGSVEEQRLLTEVGELMQQLRDRAVPQEARRHMARGQAAVTAAQDTEGFARAANEFKAATSAAPWWGDAYYNLGIVADKAGQHDRAMRSLKIYIAARPDAPDAAEAETLIYQIEFHKEEAARTALAVKERQAQERRERIGNLAGTWVSETVSGSELFSRTFWELVPTGPNTFELKLKHFESHTRWGSAIAPVKHHYELTISGDRISGTEYRKNDPGISSKLGCNTRDTPPYRIPVSGTLAADGLSISIMQGGYDYIDIHDCKWKYRSGGSPSELRKR